MNDRHHAALLAELAGITRANQTLIEENDRLNCRIQELEGADTEEQQ